MPPVWAFATFDSDMFLTFAFINFHCLVLAVARIALVPWPGRRPRTFRLPLRRLRDDGSQDDRSQVQISGTVLRRCSHDPSQHLRLLWRYYHFYRYYYLHEGGYVFVAVCVSVCVPVGLCAKYLIKKVKKRL